MSCTARGGLSLISASASRSACCSSLAGWPRHRLRAASSSPRDLSVRSTTNGDDSGALSTKSARASDRISLSRPPVFHSASMNSRLRRSVTLPAAPPPRGPAGSGACRFRTRWSGCAAPLRFHSQSSAVPLRDFAGQSSKFSISVVWQYGTYCSPVCPANTTEINRSSPEPRSIRFPAFFPYTENNLGGRNKKVRSAVPSECIKNGK